MIKNILIIAFVLLTINCVSAATITVNSDSTNNSFSSIQDAIASSQENDSIIIDNGVYTGNLIIDKPLRISSSSLDPEDVIITSNNSSSPIIYVISDNVEIIGLTIVGSSEIQPIAGISLDNVSNSRVDNNKITYVKDGILINHSSRNHVQNNALFLNTLHGIYLVNSADNDLEANRIFNNKHGFYLDLSNQNIVNRNNISNNSNYGIALRGSDTNEITNNQLSFNNYGLTLTDSHQNMIVGNNGSNNKMHGFLLWTATSNILKGNFLSENKGSGVYLLPSSSNNTLDENILSKNFNGMSIESTSNNFIVNNTFNSNDDYGIFHLFAGDENIIEGNVFQDNIPENKKIVFWQQIVLFILVFLIITGIAFYFKIPWLKKGLLGLGILIAVSLILIIAWYFPFESDLPGNNVYVEDLEINAVPINETHSRVTLSMNLNYLYKNSFSQTNDHGQMTDNLPVFVQVMSSTPMDGSYSDDEMVLECEDEVILEYSGKNLHECTIDLESEKAYYLLIQVQMVEELQYPHPYYGETKWKLLGGLSEDLDLRE
ncbi:NosD domain-containing protein [Methanolobus sp. ZRKC2]|uniref:right-handed parallel beta-helix repeat-containing protein n=1 Tax=Methanolobus sp. ZRKC2 TaxID=3125783 RepID=UPI003250F108